MDLRRNTSKVLVLFSRYSGDNNISLSVHAKSRFIKVNAYLADQVIPSQDLFPLYSEIALCVLRGRTKLVFRKFFSLLTLQRPLLTASELDELAKQTKQDFLDLDMEQLPQLVTNPAQKKQTMDVHPASKVRALNMQVVAET